MVEPSEAGVRVCMRCGWKFVSPDVLRIGRCQDCKQGEETYSTRQEHTVQLHVSGQNPRQTKE